MNLSTVLPFLAAWPLFSSGAELSAANPLNITASAAKGGHSVLQCWQLSDVPKTAGIGDASFVIESLGTLGEGSFWVLPAGQNLGLHAAPKKQYDSVQLPSCRSDTDRKY